MCFASSQSKPANIQLISTTFEVSQPAIDELKLEALAKAMLKSTTELVFQALKSS